MIQDDSDGIEIDDSEFTQSKKKKKKSDDDED